MATNSKVFQQIDSRSFHAFEREGAKLLFDRATSSTMALSDSAFRFFEEAERRGFQSAMDLMSTSNSSEAPSEEEIGEALDQMLNSGMFKFRPVASASETFIDSLWNHHPYRIQMLMAQGCNLGCRYCYAWRNGSNQLHTTMPFDIARQAVDYLVWRSADRPNLQVTFFGGEPLLNFDVIKQVVSYCRQLESAGAKKFVFEVCTNATLLDKKTCDYLVKEKFLLFMSIDGWREMHNYNRPSLGKDDLYDTIVANARYANDAYLKAGLGSPKVRANLTNKFNDLATVGEYLGTLGFGLIDVGAIEPLPHGDQSPAALSEDQADELQLKCEALVVDALRKYKAGESMGPHQAKFFASVISQAHQLEEMGVTCGVGRNTLIVDNKGYLFPCHRYEGMDSFALGHVSTGLDKEKTTAYYRRINRHATAHCGDCWIRDYCGGGCVWLLSAKDGHIADPTLRECARRRRGMETKIWARMNVREHSPEFFTNRGEPSLEGPADVVGLPKIAQGRKAVSLSVLN